MLSRKCFKSDEMLGQKCFKSAFTHLFVLQFVKVHRCNLVEGNLHVALNAFLYGLNFKNYAFRLSPSKIVQMSSQLTANTYIVQSLIVQTQCK